MVPSRADKIAVIQSEAMIDQKRKLEARLWRSRSLSCSGFSSLGACLLVSEALSGDGTLEGSRDVVEFCASSTAEDSL